jgi:hypothetical protein
MTGNMEFGSWVKRLSEKIEKLGLGFEEEM